MVNGRPYAITGTIILGCRVKQTWRHTLVQAASIFQQFHNIRFFPFSPYSHRLGYYTALAPPSTMMVWPVMNPAPSEHRNITG
jgi:hypothetical protein